MGKTEPEGDMKLVNRFWRRMRYPSSLGTVQSEIYIWAEVYSLE